MDFILSEDQEMVRDAARRLMGETVEMMVPTERKGLMDRLLGRRAA